jgi:hypothetical protein
VGPVLVDVLADGLRLCPVPLISEWVPFVIACCLCLCGEKKMDDALGFKDVLATLPVLWLCSVNQSARMHSSKSTAEQRRPSSSRLHHGGLGALLQPGMNATFLGICLQNPHSPILPH